MPPLTPVALLVVLSPICSDVYCLAQEPQRPFAHGETVRVAEQFLPEDARSSADSDRGNLEVAELSQEFQVSSDSFGGQATPRTSRSPTPDQPQVRRTAVPDRIRRSSMHMAKAEQAPSPDQFASSEQLPPVTAIPNAQGGDAALAAEEWQAESAARTHSVPQAEGLPSHLQGQPLSGVPNTVATSDDPEYVRSEDEAVPGDENGVSWQEKWIAPVVNYSRRYASRVRSPYLCELPAMMGGGTQSGSLGFSGVVSGALVSPFVGGVGLNIAQNNSPLPSDRAFVTHRRFFNATSLSLASGTESLASDDYFDLYTAGLEKSFLNSRFSVEVRAPFMSSSLTEAQSINGNTFGFSTESLAFVDSVFKGVLWEGETVAVSAGSGMRFYTGATVGDFAVNQETWRYERTGVDFVPFLGISAALPWGTFSQAIFQYNLPTADDVVTASVGGTDFSGELRRSGTFGLSWSVGKWLMVDPRRRFIQNLAATFEANYTLVTDDAQQVTVTPAGGLIATQFTQNRFETLSLGTGLTSSVYKGITLQLGASYPVELSDTRFSDFETHAALNWRF